MDILHYLVDFVLHLDEHLTDMVSQYGTLVYVILFIIVFSETGFVVTPFLPGDSLLFAAGALAANAQNGLNLTLLILVFLVAAVLGNTVNYLIGSYIGPRIFGWERMRFIRKEQLLKTQVFYEKHGGKAVILSRFVPFFRTFVPFIAGIGAMKFDRYTLFNVIGAFLWVVPITFLGYKFGEHPFIKENFSMVVLAVILITLLPAFIGFGRELFGKKSA